MNIVAMLYLYEEGRKTPFSNGYRPLFNVNGNNYSGSINLENKNYLLPGEKSIVSIVFLNNHLKLKEGDILYFSENTKVILGEVEILEIENTSDYC